MNSKPARRTMICFWFAWLAACDSVSAKPDHGETHSAVAKSSKPSAEQATADQSAAGPTPSRCIEVCKLSDSLHCAGQDKCLTTCEEMRADAGKCKGHVDAFLACLTLRSAGDFECGDEDLPSVRDGICEAEQATLAHCVMDTL